MSKICEQCQAEFTPSRNDARFCTQSCKSKYWYNQKNKESEIKEVKNDLHATLKGVIDETIENHQNEVETIQIKKESMAFTNLKNKESEMIMNKLLYGKKIKKVQEDITYIRNSNGILLKAACIGAGGILADTKFENPVKNIVGAAFGYLAGEIINESLADEREKAKRKAIAQKETELKGLNENLKIINSNLNIIKSQLLNTQQYIITEITKPRQSLAFANPVLKGITQKSESQVAEPIQTEKPKVILQKRATYPQSERIISSQELANHDYKALRFTGKWSEFIGLPSINFQCAIHGRAGEGKSTFAIQFAMYLAENFGRVIYISSEEGFSKTFKDKFVRNNALSENLYVADLRSYDEIQKEIPVDAYHFIFIDSLDNMNIDVEKLKELRERYKNSSIVSISQATKDGKMRGSYQIVHDVDIEIIVIKGVAMTNKNRFKEKELEMRVF